MIPIYIIACMYFNPPIYPHPMTKNIVVSEKQWKELVNQNESRDAYIEKCTDAFAEKPFIAYAALDGAK